MSLPKRLRLAQEFNAYGFPDTRMTFPDPLVREHRSKVQQKPLVEARLKQILTSKMAFSLYFSLLFGNQDQRPVRI
jgi:hypothetical protein